MPRLPPGTQWRRGTWSADCGGWGRKLQGEKEGKKAGRLGAADTQSLASHHLSGRVEMPWSLEAVCSFQPTAHALSARFSLKKQSQSSVCTVNTIKQKPLEMSKGKLDNLCLDAGIWSLKVKETGQTPEVRAARPPFGTLASCHGVFAHSPLKSVCLVFLKYHQILQTSFG